MLSNMGIQARAGPGLREGRVAKRPARLWSAYVRATSPVRGQDATLISAPKHVHQAWE